jgi:hypothetical protein
VGERAYGTRRKKLLPAAPCKPKRICRGQLPPARRERVGRAAELDHQPPRARRKGKRKVAEEAREMAAPGEEEEEPTTPTA